MSPRFRALTIGLVVTALALLTAIPALAVYTQNPVWNATYVAAFQPTFGHQGVPYSGLMKLKFNHGIISGTYESTSIRPDPMNGRIIAVTGGLKDGNVMLRIASLSISNGTMDNHGTISGTASWQGKLFNFMAKIKPPH